MAYKKIDMCQSFSFTIIQNHISKRMATGYKASEYEWSSYNIITGNKKEKIIDSSLIL